MNWQEINKRKLMAAVEVVRLRLLHQEAEWQAAQAAEQALAQEYPAPSALDQLCGAFGLSPFERELLVLLAGVELSAEFAEAVPNRAPTFGLALATLSEPHWDALGPHAPLRRWHLLELASSGLTSAHLRLDERVLHHFTGINGMDARLAPLLRPVPAPEALPESQEEIAGRIARFWEEPHRPMVCVTGTDPATRQVVLARAARRLGLSLWSISAAEALESPLGRDLLTRLWEREAVLLGAALLVELEDGQPELEARIRRFLDGLSVVVGVSTRDRLPAGHRATVEVAVRRPRPAEQAELLRQQFENPGMAAAVKAVVSQFDLSSAQLTSVALVAGTAPPEEQAEILWREARTIARPNLEGLGQRVEVRARWEDIVLPDLPRQVMEDMCRHARNRLQVQEEWGFSSLSSRGLGLSAMFAGPSGTGKTMAAEVLANTLQVDLYRVDLSTVMSKYIGETEKNLRRIFDALEGSGAILLFDEADALFGKRGEVKDSHDRYANMEVGYLLQRMESYRGIAILTTNLKNNIDAAFLRRIRFVVQFPFPTKEQRVEIWRRAFPSATPTEGLDYRRLSQLNVTGGYIRNIALNAAVLAADEGAPVRMDHLHRAARSEYLKLEQPLTPAEFGGWP